MTSKRFKRNRRDGGRFIQIPVAVLESPDYTALSSSAKALLWDLASQYRGDNNGRLLAGWTFMSQERGWVNKGTLITAKRSLVANARLVVETRKGQFPSTSGWFACTWWPLDWTSEMDITEQAFPRGAYRQKAAVKDTALGTNFVPHPALQV